MAVKTTSPQKVVSNDKRIEIVPQRELDGDGVESQNAVLVSLIRGNTIGVKSNEEHDGVWRVQGYFRDEDVDAFPRNQTSDLLVKDCAGEKTWTTCKSHGSCRKLAIVNCSQVRVLCDHAMEEGLLSRCNTVELILGGYPPKLVLDKCRTVRLIMSRPDNAIPELECHDCVQIIYQSAVLPSKGRATAEDIMLAPKFDPIVVRGNKDRSSRPADDSVGGTPPWKSNSTYPVETPVVNKSAAALGPADIGVELLITQDKYMQIVRVIPYGGAFVSGQVKTGDALHSVDGVPVYGKTVQEVEERLSGAAGTSVLLALQSQGPDGLMGMWRTVLVERVQLDAAQRVRHAHLAVGFGITLVVNHKSEGEVAAVESGSAAEATGRIHVGDVITEVEGVPTPHAEEALRAMGSEARAKMYLKVRKIGGQVAAVALSKEISQVTDLLGRRWCSIKHSYIPRQVDEMELQAGDSVFVVEAAEDDGWYIAEKDGKRGLVPATHVVFHGHDTAPTPTVKMAQASHNYQALNMDELSFKKGDVMPILSEAADPGWFVSRVDGRDGLVPSTHFTFLTSNLPAVPLARAAQHNLKTEHNWSTAAAGPGQATACWSCGTVNEGGVVFCSKCRAPVSLGDKVRRP